MGKTLNIVERAFHGTIEEQDDSVVWMVAALKGAGADPSVLLRGNAVNYAVSGQDVSGLTIGDIPLTVTPKIDRDIADLIAKGVEVFAVEEDIKARGIGPAELVNGVQVIPSSHMAKLWDSHDDIWHW